MTITSGSHSKMWVFLGGLIIGGIIAYFVTFQFKIGGASIGLTPTATPTSTIQSTTTSQTPTITSATSTASQQGTTAMTAMSPYAI